MRKNTSRKVISIGKDPKELREKLTRMGWLFMDEDTPFSSETTKSIPISFNPATSQGISYYQSVHRQSPILPISMEKGHTSKAA